MHQRRGIVFLSSLHFLWKTLHATLCITDVHTSYTKSIHSINKHLLSTCLVPDTMLGKQREAKQNPYYYGASRAVDSCPKKIGKPFKDLNRGATGHITLWKNYFAWDIKNTISLYSCAFFTSDYVIYLDCSGAVRRMYWREIKLEAEWPVGRLLK